MPIASGATIQCRIPYIARSLNYLRQFNVNARPYVTFVSYFRNDSYTSDFELRVRRATTFLVRQLQRAAIESELILVEWNPPPDRPLIIESLGPLPQGDSVQVRGIIVGKEHHQKFTGSQEWGMNPAAAANVGLRRAQGRFVTPKAADTLSVRRDRRHHRPPRPSRERDSIAAIAATSPSPLRDLQELPRRRAAGPSGKPGQHAAQQDSPSSQWHIRDLHTNACGDFLLMSRTMWHTVRGLSARRHGPVAGLRFADHARGGRARIA